MQVLALNSRIAHRLNVRTMESKIQRMVREAARLIVTRSAAVEELRRRPKLVFSACRTSRVDK
jgi:hypothetical protein